LETSAKARKVALPPSKKKLKSREEEEGTRQMRNKKERRRWKANSRQAMRIARNGGKPWAYLGSDPIAFL